MYKGGINMFHLEKKQILLGGIIIVVIITIIGYYFYTNIQQSEEEIFLEEDHSLKEEKQEEKQEEQVVVHIAGEVKNPGIIRTTEGARIADIIENAGGLNKDADITNINLAYPVEDGQKIVIPKQGEQAKEEITKENVMNQTQETSNKKINLNKATSEELQTLQGIRRSNSTKNYYLSKRKPESLNKLKI